MTAGSLASRPAPSHNQTARAFFEHSSAPRINTDVVIAEALRAEYPQLHLTVVPQYSCNLLAWSGAGNANITPMDNEKDQLRWKGFIPPGRRLDGHQGSLADQVQFGKFLLDWNRRDFVVYIANGRDGAQPYPTVVNQYILSSSVEQTNGLLIECGRWNSTLHNEIWIFDAGYWQKSAALWQSVQKSNWEDVILEDSMKKAIIKDVENFFDSRGTYQRLRVPWKRGIIYYGPPGNGKTISIKAMMNMLYKREDPIPTLYVRSLSSFGGPEYAINRIFDLARRTAPCYLVFEDLDSIVTEQVRSYFLNEVDGLQANDGIMMIGSTNHLDRLDPGISKRPSRFDRKYLFPNPNLDERTKYAKFWQSKLGDNDDIEFPDKLCSAIAKITTDFSFAYMQEAFVAALLAIAADEDKHSNSVCLECLEEHAGSRERCDSDAKRPYRGLCGFVWKVRQTDDEDPSLDDLVLWRQIKKQVRILREELESEQR